MPVFDEFNSSEMNWTRSRYSFSSKKLVIFEMTLCLYTGVQHERFKVKLLHYSIF